MFGLTWAQVSGLLQRVLMFGGGFAVAKGWISQELLVQIVGALVGLGGVAWGAWVNREASRVQSAASIPGVAVVVNPQAASPAVVDVARDPAQTDVRVDR